MFGHWVVFIFAVFDSQALSMFRPIDAERPQSPMEILLNYWKYMKLSVESARQEITNYLGLATTCWNRSDVRDFHLRTFGRPEAISDDLESRKAQKSLTTSRVPLKEPTPHPRQRPRPRGEAISWRSEVLKEKAREGQAVRASLNAITAGGGEAMKIRERSTRDVDAYAPPRLDYLVAYLSLLGASFPARAPLPRASCASPGLRREIEIDTRRE